MSPAPDGAPFLSWWRRHPAPAFLLWLAFWQLLPLLVVLQRPIPPVVNTVWDGANALGYLALSLLMMLFVYRGRTRSFPFYSGRFFAAIHRHMGYAALALIVAHAGWILLFEPLVLDYLLPTAPLYMLAGNLAFLLVLLLVFISLSRVRRWLWRDYVLFRRVHAVLACAVLALALLHVCISGFYANTLWKTAALASLCIAVLLYYSADRAPSRNAGEKLLGGSAQRARIILYSSVVLATLCALSLILVPGLDV